MSVNGIWTIVTKTPAVSIPLGRFIVIVRTVLMAMVLIVTVGK